MCCPKTASVRMPSCDLRTAPALPGTAHRRRGTLAGWRHGDRGPWPSVTSPYLFCPLHARLPPYSPLSGMEGRRFSPQGESTDGKTTIMKSRRQRLRGQRAASHTWRAAGNAIEGSPVAATMPCSAWMRIEELDGREAGQTAYMAGERTRQGSPVAGRRARIAKQWRLLFPVHGGAVIGGSRCWRRTAHRRGMEVRTLQSVEGDTGKHGAFEQLHGLADGRTLPRYLEGQHRGASMALPFAPCPGPGR